ncbi:response regulator [Aquihabitans sp. G128]|uniref:response regulator n=1 Tax=Aquihabitans sp. G128 TaxID=2849779 RepID=UPI001C23D905|nr:response regulator [Aquihabitans sp. G128]QXC60669.1 response regulator [Aquihabitans sp. G128]
MHRILLAEDNKINQVVAAGALKKLGFLVDIVDDGVAAAAACAADEYDAVLMDVMMPVMDGYQATRAIRQHERWLGLAPVPIIGLSARALAGDREVALDAGMDDYLTKPIRTAELEAALARFLPASGDQEHDPTAPTALFAASS